MPAHLAFYKATGDFSNHAIRAACSLRHGQRVQYSHIEILQTAPMLEPIEQTTGQLCISASKRDGRKVRAKWINFKDGHWDFFSLPKDRDPFPAASQVVGKPYDYVGMLLCLTPFARAKPDTWFCSQLVAQLMGLWNPETYDPHKLAIALRKTGALVKAG